MSELSPLVSIGLASLLGVILGYVVASLIKRTLAQSYAQALAESEGLKVRLVERDQQLAQAQSVLSLEKQELQSTRELCSELKIQSKANQVTAEQRQQQLEDLKKELSESVDALRSLETRYHALSQNHAQLETSLAEKIANFEAQRQDFEESKQLLKTEFHNLANQVLEEKGKRFSQQNQTSLDAMLKPFKAQIEGFQNRVNQVHSESVKGNASLEAEIKKILEVGVKMSDEANSLATALKGDKKTTGNWGEIQLEKTLQLAGLVSGDHYSSQKDYKDAARRKNFPDFVVNLPDNKHMVIDSKVSLVAYERAVSAESDSELKAALDNHVNDVKNHIDSLHKKDYSNLIGMRSPSFVLMFMPIEPAYIEAMKHNRELFDYGYKKNVIMVSHTTLMPILRTVANLWRIERGNEEAREISEKAGDIFNQVCLVAERLDKLGGTLATVSNHYNSTVKGLVGQQGLYGKVERFKSLSTKVTKSMPDLQPLHTDLENQRLELVVEPIESPDNGVMQEP